MMRLKFLLSLLVLLYVNKGYAQNTIVNGAIKYQTIHGLGVNANPQSWNINPEAVKKVLDELIDDMGATSFRLMFDDCDWEKVNDNDDPDSYNWTYYDSVYSSPRFTGIWEMIRYLNGKGISDITLSPDGATPGWMGGTTLYPKKEAEYAEMMTSMVYYAKKRLNPAVQFNLLSPINESTCRGLEGVVTTPAQFGKIFSAIASHLIRDGLTDITIIGPDDCGGWLPNVQAMLNDSITMSKVTFFGQHEYGNSVKKSRETIAVINNSAYPDRGMILTEVNAVCQNCDGGVYLKDYGFSYYAGPAYQYILQHLNIGVNGIQVWEAYDSEYHHPNRTLTWSMWGIFGVNDINFKDVYIKRAHFYTLKQLFKFVKPGYKRIDISTTLPDMTVSAFQDTASETMIITGINSGSSAREITGLSLNLPASSSLEYYYTDAAHNFAKGTEVKVKGKEFSKLIPANTVFTFVARRK